MITKCCFCDYSKSKPLSKPILEVLAEPDLTSEDQILWMQRLIKQYGTKDYHSIKIHMGVKHKDQTFKYIAPDIVFEPQELKLIAEQIASFSI